MLVQSRLASLGGEGEQERGCCAAQRGHTNYHACPCGCISSLWGRGVPLPDLRLFPRGQEVFGLAAGRGWGRIQHQGSVCRGWTGCSPLCSPGAVNWVVFVFLIHPLLPFVPTQVFLLSLIFSELTLGFSSVSGKLRPSLT